MSALAMMAPCSCSSCSLAARAAGSESDGGAVVGSKARLKAGRWFRLSGDLWGSSDRRSKDGVDDVVAAGKSSPAFAPKQLDTILSDQDLGRDLSW